MIGKYAQYSKSARVGIALLIGVLLLFVLLFSKDVINTKIMSGRTITATFAEDYKLRPNVSVVKVGYVKVGKVSGVDRNDDGTASVKLKVDKDVLKNLGSKPTATIRSTTLLGGSYFVDLHRGGDRGAFTASGIPMERTALPVELDKVARALQPDALKGLRGTLGAVDDTLDGDGQAALQRLLASAPETLDPAAGVLKAARGTSSGDLTDIVGGLESASSALTRTDGQLDAILVDLRTTSRTVAAHTGDVATTIDRLPATLASTSTGLVDLKDTMAVLRDVADDVEPVVEELDDTLDEVNPVLRDARPVVSDARILVDDARPVIDGLVPVAVEADEVIDDLDGPVLERLNGPVTDFLYDDYQGTGQYDLTSSDRSMYEEIVYTFVDLNRASALTDRNGHAVSFQPGIGTGTVSGLPISPEALFKGLTQWLWPAAPLDTLAPLSRPTAGTAAPEGSGGTAGTGSAPASDAPGSLVSQIEGLLNGMGG